MHGSRLKCSGELQEKLTLGLRGADDSLNFTSPISERLRQQSTGLRSTADPSLLIQSLLDLGELHFSYEAHVLC